jgi:hypothetical protein
MKPQIDESTYREERRLCDLDQEWSRQFIQPNGWTVIPADAKRPAEIAGVDNDMRGRVEQYELLNEKPDRVFCYVRVKPNEGTAGRSAIFAGQELTLTVWTGLEIGRGRIFRVWTDNFGGRRAAFRATIGGRKYSGVYYFSSGDYARLNALKESGK